LAIRAQAKPSLTLGVPYPWPKTTFIHPYGIPSVSEGTATILPVAKRFKENLHSLTPDTTIPDPKFSFKIMKRNLILLGAFVAIAIGWKACGSDLGRSLDTSEPPRPAATKPQTDTVSQRFKCDGRTRCSQMTSCEEAEFFLKNCPGVEMDGDGDGVPCEKQWCR
jgi:hypothetical protein